MNSLPVPQHVAENALSRSIRIRRPADALYWFNLLIAGGVSPQKLLRRLFLSSCRDNLDIATMRAASNLLVNKNEDPKEKYTVVLAMAASHKLWSCPEGRGLVKLVCHWKRQNSFRDNTVDELSLKLGAAIDCRNLGDVIGSLSELLTRHYMFKEGKLHEKLCSIFAPKIEANSPLEQCFTFWQEHQPILESNVVGDETLIYLLATWLVTDVFGQGVNLSKKDMWVITAARRRDSEPEPVVPSWAYPKDRRFDATWESYANMAAMMEEYEELDPADEGVLIRTKDGIWKPVVKEEDGMFIVQSEQDPFKYYEVSLMLGQCNCQDNQRRGGVCKHQTHAQTFADEHLPF